MNQLKEKGILKLRLLTSNLRILPSFIIAGFPRCGTTSLYNYLVSHPSIVPALKKEIRFFNQYYSYGLNWYKLFFPTFFSKYKIGSNYRDDFITGDGSSTYVHHPLSSVRIKKVIPNVKIIILLRNPVERAFSQYYHVLKQNIESITFEKAIEIELERIKGEWDKMSKDSIYYSKNYHYFSYLSAGIYIDKLKSWYEVFPKDQILILSSEEMYKNTQKIFDKTIQFLNLKKWNLPKYERFNFYDDKPLINQQIRKKLYAFFKPHNESLYKFLGKNFKWEE